MMIVGEGRAGKTAFSRSIIGDKFMVTDSTVGISQFSCLINQMSASGSGSLWSKSTGRAKEYESAIARNMKQAKDNVSSKEEKSILGSSLSESRQVDEIDNRAAFYATNNDDDSYIIETPEGSSPVGKAPTSENNTSKSSAKATALDHEEAASTTYDDNDDEKEQEAMTVERRVVDEDLVAKCLADEIETSSSIHISVFDYGGQDVFTAIHHLFLTAYGVYALCFNMEWLLAEDKTEKERCLKFLKFGLVAYICIHVVKRLIDVLHLF